VLSEQTKQKTNRKKRRTSNNRPSPVAARELTRTPEDVCAIAPAPAPGPGAQPVRLASPVRSSWSLTSSSFVFRLLTLFQVGADPATRAYYVSAAQAEPG